MVHRVYKIVPASLWVEAEANGLFKGASIDLADGFIHLSTREQVAETARLYFRGQTDLLLVELDGDALGERLVYEKSRNAALFPHFYGEIPVAAVVSKYVMTVNERGEFVFPF
ncbi:MAG: hypothetical protein RIR97_1628 [Pseudomonadota bacterium]|jgi:uncharacterized protein (DUF952 family)